MEGRKRERQGCENKKIEIESKRLYIAGLPEIMPCR
jgi:hypothetical protein